LKIEQNNPIMRQPARQAVKTYKGPRNSISDAKPSLLYKTVPKREWVPILIRGAPIKNMPHINDQHISDIL
jgi:hypothetical protein